MKLVYTLLITLMALSTQVMAYATAYELEAMYSFESANFFPEFSYQRIYENQVVLDASLSIVNDELGFGFGMSKFYNAAGSKKYKLGLTVYSQFQNLNQSALYVSIGQIKRYSSRMSWSIALHTPILRIEQADALMVSSGVHYYIGSGRNNEQRSPELKKVRRRFLRLF